jgi:hypothetical protein
MFLGTAAVSQRMQCLREFSGSQTGDRKEVSDRQKLTALSEEE